MDKKTLEKANSISATIKAMDDLTFVMHKPYPQFSCNGMLVNSARFDRETLNELKNTIKEFIRKRRSELEGELKGMPVMNKRTPVMNSIKFWRKKQNATKADSAVEVVNLLLNDKIDQMINVDTLISLLIQKGVFTKDEFDRIKQAIKGTDQYQKIYHLTDRVAEALDPALAHTRITDQELEELLACLSPGEIDE